MLNSTIIISTKKLQNNLLSQIVTESPASLASPASYTYTLMDPRSTSSPELFADLRHTLLESHLPSTVTTTPPVRPVSFSGEAASCSGFLLQCSLYFKLQPHLFVTEQVKVTFIISLLSRRALQWAEILWNSQSPWIHSLDSFVKHIREVFSLSTMEITVNDELFQLRQLHTCPVHPPRPAVSTIQITPDVSCMPHRHALVM
uniref:DUF4939 domain-containing protein n=1 Tax=Cyprinus carpio TaxID=7962 RepID=A0A8C1QPZ5_CYPCA